MKLDEIGEWSELKLDILKKYAGAYCTILRARNLHPIYIDGFAGAGTHIRKGTKELIPGSPLNALNIEPATLPLKTAAHTVPLVIGHCCPNLIGVKAERTEVLALGHLKLYLSI